MTVETPVEQPKRMTLTEEVARLREELRTGMDLCKAELDQMKSMQTTPPQPSVEAMLPSSDEGFEFQMFGPICCPECDLLLEGYSATGERTRYYKHPFGQSPKLRGQQCRLKGQLFETPKIILKPVAQQSKRS